MHYLHVTECFGAAQKLSGLAIHRTVKSAIEELELMQVRLTKAVIMPTKL